MVTQISIFAENKKGTMFELTDILAKNNINIIALVTNDSAEFGIVRMLVSDPQAAYKELSAAGYLVRLDEVIGVEMDDHPGGMSTILDDIEKINVNIDYIYISYDREKNIPLAVIHAGDTDELEESLEAKGYTVRHEL